MHYVLDEKGNRVEGLSKEEVLSVIQQAIDNGSLEEVVADSAFVSKLKCCVCGDTHGMAFVTQAKYNELKANNQLIVDTVYYITDDTTGEIIDDNIEALGTSIKGLETTVGNIGERLNNLGFKEGTIEFDSSLTINDGAIATNYLHRQGNYVLGRLQTNANKITGATANCVLGKVSNDFIPKEEVSFIAYYSFYTNLLIEVFVKIDTDGNVNIKSDSGWTGLALPPLDVLIGYEAKPIE